MTRAQDIVVEQRHRNAAADLLLKIAGVPHLSMINAMRVGQLDKCNEVQAFARFEQSIIPSAPVSSAGEVNAAVLATCDRLAARMGGKFTPAAIVGESEAEQARYAFNRIALFLDRNAFEYPGGDVGVKRDLAPVLAALQGQAEAEREEDCPYCEGRDLGPGGFCIVGCRGGKVRWTSANVLRNVKFWHDADSKARIEGEARCEKLTSAATRLVDALAVVSPISTNDTPDYAELFFGEHQTQAMTMCPGDWLNIEDAYLDTRTILAQPSAEVEK